MPDVPSPKITSPAPGATLPGAPQPIVSVSITTDAPGLTHVVYMFDYDAIGGTPVAHVVLAPGTTTAAFQASLVPGRKYLILVGVADAQTVEQNRHGVVVTAGTFPPQSGGD